MTAESPCLQGYAVTVLEKRGDPTAADVKKATFVILLSVRGISTLREVKLFTCVSLERVVLAAASGQHMHRPTTKLLLRGRQVGATIQPPASDASETHQIWYPPSETGHPDRCDFRDGHGVRLAMLQLGVQLPDDGGWVNGLAPAKGQFIHLPVGGTQVSTTAQPCCTSADAHRCACSRSRPGCTAASRVSVVRAAPARQVKTSP